jgi:hypothetical protein
MANTKRGETRLFKSCDTTDVSSWRTLPFLIDYENVRPVRLRSTRCPESPITENGMSDVLQKSGRALAEGSHRGSLDMRVCDR